MKTLSIKPNYGQASFPERSFIMRLFKRLKEKKSVKGKLGKDQNGGDYIHLESDIRLAYYKVSLNETNVFKRDGNCCVYCGDKSNLRLGYLIPLAKLGRKVWKNTVTVCKKCETKKGDRTAQEAGMLPSRKPFKPIIL